MKTVCQAKNCRNTPFCRGYCKKHYQQLNRYGHVKETTISDPNKIQKCGKAAFIHLRDKQGNTKAMAIIDREDVELVKDYIWKVDSGRVIAKGERDGERFRVKLTQLVLGVDGKFLVKHINEAPLDCRKEDLVLTSRREIGLEPSDSRTGR